MASCSLLAGALSTGTIAALWDLAETTESPLRLFVAGSPVNLVNGNLIWPS